MKPFLFHSLICVACLAPVTAASRDLIVEPAAAPDVASPTTYTKDGLKMQVPGNWTVIKDHPSNEEDQRHVIIEADKTRFEVLNLEVVINLVHTSVVVSLPDWAAYSYSEEVGDSENYGPPKYSAYQLAPGVEAHATQFQHNIFESNQPYARRLHVLAVKRCSVEWYCYASTRTLSANRKAAEAGIRKIMESVTFAD
ncbi:hypothetical protein [Stenotrophomonas maltophilia]|uniref:hypothetical protein n=1 Tax=Stenotrophomonas maltophilia group TaxID=995085 RepID=UPI000708CF1E|nr:hypothetical protein [Stenotrophomonas maltophilia]KRG52911.1 hypothetical protein ARC02_13070 [Stenotrophomonas maltophilia]NNH49511.1 hypothetical protein [Stenotrophomonas maltophilia]VEE53526.1 Uncharacterised protein [Stenotrophomonas maltophilia]